MSGRSPGAGHNNGPPLDDDDPAATIRTCRWCRHWSPPTEREEREYEHFRLGLSRRRVKRPSGACDRVLMAPGKPLAFSATVAEFSCLNFAARPLLPVEKPRRSGFVTIYEGDKIVWRGNAEDLPEEYR
ncbi:hypothetical protein [Edaphosphingomonas haloaromaticamans]|uniref:Uncharacterized protein n=1 Tax=Edaphosphingomonas haloaromaticamans TaxID=653954 RepID=A0A1S1HD97_9SPHN|nr:hypothetical protein [Sphingomonas haloaromaticamans]OHT20097.1 hypothetical protein BHE75_02091 [Sphingomonas haloaromaticamans]TNE42940.1 MAG: hypothetical protein EP345_05260 [Sphingomonadales bacterium]